jgi:hypothetical protein
MASNSNRHTETLKLKAGTFVTIPVMLDSSSQVIEYSFAVNKGLDAELSCSLYETDDSTVAVELLAPRRIVNVADSIRVNLRLEPGGHRMLEFKLSNVFSWIRSKTFTYTIAVQPEPHAPSLQPQAPLRVIPPAGNDSAALVALYNAERDVERLQAAADVTSQEQSRAVLQLSSAEAELQKLAQKVSELRSVVVAAMERNAAANAAVARARDAASAAKTAAALSAASPPIYTSLGVASGDSVEQ